MVLKEHSLARWLSWLERRPVTAEVTSSSLVWVVCVVNISCECGILAQLGEHLPYKQRVIGSSPIGPICLKNEKGVLRNPPTSWVPP